MTDDVFNQIDNDNNGCIDYSEFLAATINRDKFLSKQRLQQAFKMFDKDGDGNIDTDELQKTFKQIKCDEGVWTKLLEEVD